MKTALLSFAMILGLSSVSEAAVNCYIRAFDGHYVTAVGGGGRTTDVIHTNASRPSTWEKFQVIDLNLSANPRTYAIRTASGHFLTAVGGGGRADDVLHTDARRVQAWEQFQLVPVGFGVYGIRTVSGNYLTAQDSGGRTTQVMRSNANELRDWEKFRFVCGF